MIRMSSVEAGQAFTATSTSVRLRAAVAAGELEWSGKKLAFTQPEVVNEGQQLSDIVSENRD